MGDVAPEPSGTGCGLEPGAAHDIEKLWRARVVIRTPFEYGPR